MKKYNILKNQKIGENNFNKHIEREAKKHSTKKKRDLTIEKSKIIINTFPKLFDCFKDAKKILCIGCRHDAEVEMFETKDNVVVGIDVANKTQKIKKIPAEKIDDIFQEDEFDLVYTSHSLEHVVSPDKVLKNIRMIASKGCYVILPLETRRAPGNDHPVIFDISKQKKNASKEELISSISNDFKIFEPYEIKDIFCHEYLGDDQKKFEPEFHIYFEWK